MISTRTWVFAATRQPACKLGRWNKGYLRLPLFFYWQLIGNWPHYRQLTHGAAQSQVQGVVAFRSIVRYMGAMREAYQRTVGIDPGAKGAIALIEGESLIIRDMPTVKVGKKAKDRVDPAALALILREFNPDHVWVELVHSMPKNGAASSFAFGEASGYAKGIPLALGFPVTLVGPAQWKAAMRCPADKNATRARASQLLPRHAALWPLVKHDGRAEAALIALYGSSKTLAIPSIEW